MFECKTHNVIPESRCQDTIMTLSFRTDMPGQTVQTLIRLLVGAVWSGSALFAILSASFKHITLW